MNPPVSQEWGATSESWETCLSYHKISFTDPVFRQVCYELAQERKHRGWSGRMLRGYLLRELCCVCVHVCTRARARLAISLL